MVAEIDDTKKSGDTIGGVVEVVRTACRTVLEAMSTGTAA